MLQPSKDVFNDMLHQLDIGRHNSDGADQGFLVSYFPELLDRPMFYPPANGTKVNGTYRLPLGYQMDASYYCEYPTVPTHCPFPFFSGMHSFIWLSLNYVADLKLHWNVPCGPNSVVTFPSAPWFKPWYWWSWPVLPLGLSWHEQRRNNLGLVNSIKQCSSCHLQLLFSKML
jgi:hypothetical protein